MTNTTDKAAVHEDPFANAKVIHSYSRAQALEDGLLVDIDAIDPTLAEGRRGSRAEAGFQFPTAITKRVYDECVALNARCDFQSVAGRLWDVCWMATMKVRQLRGPGSGGVKCQFYCTRPDEPGPEDVLMGEDSTAVLTELVFHVGAGDNGEGVITIMFPDEG